MEIIKKIGKEKSEIILDDLFKIKGECDLNEAINEISGTSIPMIKGKGLLYDSDLEDALENFKVFEILSSDDDIFRFIQSDVSETMFKIKVNERIVNSEKEEYFDFNTMEESDISEVVDEEAVEEFFDSANFLKAPGKENEEEYSCYVWDDLDLFEEKSLESKKPLYIYTLLDEEGGWIVKGKKLINRIGYFVADKDIYMKNDIRFY